VNGNANSVPCICEILYHQHSLLFRIDIWNLVQNVSDIISQQDVYLFLVILYLDPFDETLSQVKWQTAINYWYNYLYNSTISELRQLTAKADRVVYRVQTFAYKSLNITINFLCIDYSLCFK